MLVLHSRLDRFAEPVPSCLATEPLATVMALFQTARCDHLLVYNSQAHLLGCVRLTDVWHQQATLSITSDSEAASQTCLQTYQPSLIQPVVCMLGERSIAAVLPQLQAITAPIVITAASGEVLGILNRDRLLTQILTQLQPFAASPPINPSPQPASPQAPFPSDCKGVPERQPYSSAVASDATNPDLLTPLIDLLEPLPIALMLQTSRGQVITRNALWREQVQALDGPEVIRQEIAQLLESPVAASQQEPAAEREDCFADRSSGLTTSGRVCHLGSKPNTCICTCTLKNGQEQILQLVKIPLGKVFSPQLCDRPADREQAATSFRLAELTDSDSYSGKLAVSVHPDPADTLWLVLAQDITEQQHLTQELAAKNADLIQLNRLKDEFLACISHELRTPLTAVLGLSSLLKDQTLGSLNQRQVHYAQLIYQSGRHLMTVVNDILDLTRMETGQLELVLESVNVSTVCQQAYEHACQLYLAGNPDADAANHLPSFSLEIDPHIDSLIADELRLRQMLVHLLSNALKFTETNQPMGLKVGFWGGWIAFTVWDRGIGIPPDKQHLIFQKFQQLENPMTRRFEGTGLGLVLTQRLARLHGGDVTFISREGQGSQFTILLPPEPPEPHLMTVAGDYEQPSAPRQGNDGGGENRASGANWAITPSLWQKTGLLRTGVAPTYPALSASNQLVLIVEAVPSYIENLSDQLTHLGYQVVIARSGTEAIEKARRLCPCIIFLNPVLPILSGWDVLTLLKSAPETRHLPVVMTTLKIDQEQANHRQADGLLSLPVQPKLLNLTLQKLVHNRQAEKRSESPGRALTILRLGATSDSAAPVTPSATLTCLLQAYPYRILEADDLEQAELLARVWKPNVVLIERLNCDPASYFQRFDQYTYLASLPLVTLDQEMTQAANQISGLLVFPCLASGDYLENHWALYSSPLIQVIQVAAGHTWQPSILAIDMAILSEDGGGEGHLTTASDRFPQTSEWLHALNQYLRTAGLRTTIGRSWQEVWQQIQTNRVNLLILCWTQTRLAPEVAQILTRLHELENRPPILVLDQRVDPTDANRSNLQTDLPPILGQLAWPVLPQSISMTELLEQIHRAMQP